MSEYQNCLYNMSAPPRSQITIAPHRSSKLTALIYVPNLPTEDQEWRQHILDWTYMKTWQDLLETIQMVEVDLPEICVVGKDVRNIQMTVAPISTIALLSRIIGNLYLKRNGSDFGYHRLSRRVSIADPKVLQQLTTNPIRSVQ